MTSLSTEVRRAKLLARVREHYKIPKPMFVAFTLLSLPLAPSVRAHNGPPFPIIVDQRVGPCIVSLWTHPTLVSERFLSWWMQHRELRFPMI